MVPETPRTSPLAGNGRLAEEVALRLPESLRDALREVLLTDGPLARLVTTLAGAHAVTLGRLVCVSPTAVRLLAAGGREAAALVAHEAEHVAQCRRLGLWRFLWRYLREYLAGRARGLSHTEAYEQISFECEARAAEAAVAPVPE